MFSLELVYWYLKNSLLKFGLVLHWIYRSD